MMKNYYISDTHFFHENVLKFEKRPWETLEQMYRDMINLHNARVTKNDNVFFLGDFAFTKDGHSIHDLVKLLNGKPHLIKGNHDVFIGKKNFNPGIFEWIKDLHELSDNSQRVILCHYPLAVWNKSHHGSVHLYGHVHSNTDSRHPILHTLSNAYNVSACLQNYQPWTLNEILERKNK